MSVKALQDYTFVSKYARYLPEQKRRETWGEAVERVRDMHIRRYPQIEQEITWAFEQVKQRRVLGSQRALQFGGSPIEKKNARIYNCLGSETEFITSEGVKKFADFQDGDTTIVMSHLGKWRKATVKCYGKDQLYKVSVVRGGKPYEICATKNHRWILKDGTVTESLAEEDQLSFGPSVFSEFDYNSSNPLERLYWCYGYTYGDGTLYKDQNGEYRWSGVRLCDSEVKYEERFLEHGFSSSSSASIEGDIIAFTGKYLKTLPDPSVDSPELIRAFVSGYLTADGTKSRSYKLGSSHGKLSPYESIQATGQESIDFIRKCFPIAGVYIVSETDITDQETNFGKRSEITIKFTVITAFGKTAKSFSVQNIEKDRIDDVWCLEVEEDQSFMLPFGLPTGNCIASYADRSRFFQECFWLLLCGCGTGFSVQKHHVNKLPNFIEELNPKSMPKKAYIIPDSIEGWSDSLGVLLSAYLENGEFPEYHGTEVVFDYSLIRPEGAPLRSSSGKSPGPKPLMRALEKIRDVLNKCVQKGLKKLRPIDAYDIVMHASDAVLSGGVRRSATICLFSPDDEEMATAKIGNWFIENPQRGRSNNSALLLRGKTTKEEFNKLMGYVREFGEPGFVWSDSTELVVNPCVTADTVVATYDGLKLVDSLIDKPFKALVDGKPYDSSNKGFWKTGIKDVVELEFSSGRILKLTTNHKLLTNNGWKEAGNITFDDEVVINNHRSGQWRVSTEDVCKWNNNDKANVAKGYCLGNLLADGNLVNNTSEMKWWGDNKDLYRNDALTLLEVAGWSSVHHKQEQESKSSYSCLQSVELKKFAESKNCLNEKKHLDKKALEGDWRYLAGLVAGYFDADGTIAVNHEKGCSLRITSTNTENLRNLQIILNSFGIYSKIYNDRYPEGERLMPDGNGGMKMYSCKATHELCVSCDSIQEFQRMIPLRNLDKISKIKDIVEGYKRTPNRTNFVDKIINKKLIGRLPVYDCTINEVHAFDANGVYAHNCVEIGLYPVDIETGETGWEACNLCEINGRYCKTEEDYEIASRAAAIIGTCQAGYTDLTYLGPTSKKILCREALLGVSITGMMDNPEVLFDPNLQQKMAKLILDVNEKIANKIGINPTARATCVKPAGTTSCILGTASGIHPHHAMRYIRRSQANHLEPPMRHIKKFNPLAVEKSVWNANGTDEVIAFCIDVPKGAKTKNDIDAITLLEYVKLTQQNWVAYGTRKERCVHDWLVHNVSNTITVKDEEWDSVGNFIYDNRQWFCGISLLPISGDKDYPQAPFTAIYTPKELVSMYGDGSVMASGLIVDGLHAFGDNLWKACDAALKQGEPLVQPEPPKITGTIILEESQKYEMQLLEFVLKIDWVRRAWQFAERYFDNDIRKMTYCLKDVSNFHYWCQLKRTYADVDFTTMVEETDQTTLEQTIACQGGACSLSYA